MSLSTQTPVYLRLITANMNQTPILWINNSQFDSIKDFLCWLTHLTIFSNYSQEVFRKKKMEEKHTDT